MVWILLVLLSASECARAVSDRELQRVARDWSTVIRASQVRGGTRSSTGSPSRQETRSIR